MYINASSGLFDSGRFPSAYARWHWVDIEAKLEVRWTTRFRSGPLSVADAAFLEGGFQYNNARELSKPRPLLTKTTPIFDRLERNFMSIVPFSIEIFARAC